MKKFIYFINVAIYLQIVNFVLPNTACAQEIAGGGNYSLAICSDITAMAWGDNSNGQLGTGNNNTSYVPLQVNGLTGIIAVAGGEGGHSLFVKNDGMVWACGYNGMGQLGNGTTTNSNIPVLVTGLTGITTVAGGYWHSLFLKNDGTVWSCGYNSYGQLGDSTTTNRSMPLQVGGLTGITKIAAGGTHSLFLKNNDTVWACGNNSFGQLGDGTATQRITLGRVNGLSGITSVAGGYSHSLFLKNDGTVWACGNNGYGTLGDGTTTDRWTPVQVNGLTGITAVAAGDYHSLFLKNDGTVWACGWNNTGQLGDGSTTDRWIPVQVSGLTGVIAIAAGGGGNGHSLFLKNDGTLWACGSNSNGQLGDGTTTQRTIPVQATGLCQVTTSVNEITYPLSISVFPNPFDHEITINKSNENGFATIYDISGREIMQQKTNNEATKVNTEKLSPGIYLLNYSEGNKTVNFKLTKFQSPGQIK